MYAKFYREKMTDNVMWCNKRCFMVQNTQDMWEVGQTEGTLVYVLAQVFPGEFSYSKNLSP